MASISKQGFTKQQLPMILTTFRMALTVPVVLLMIPNSMPWNIVSIFVFFIASITDYFDGYYARKYGAITNMGKFMDPIADKILVSSILMMLLFRGSIDPWMVMIVIARDTLVGGIRSVAAADRIVIAAKSAGKWKTALQMLCIPALIIGNITFANGHVFALGTIGYIILWVTVGLSVWSGVEYFVFFWRARQNPTNP